ncbi:MAG: STAS domain-containing protein [Candidatus Hydrogenedentes bacterium]|nr:STAS domain-containing protein [Candidatus Hydrogenedentota bacterium]
MLKLERQEIELVTVIHASGEIDGVGATAFREFISGCVADKRYQLVLDLSKVEYIDRMGVGALLECLGSLQTYHGNLKLASLNIQSRRLLTAMCLGHVFESYESEVSAVKGYQQEAA